MQKFPGGSSPNHSLDSSSSESAVTVPGGSEPPKLKLQESAQEARAQMRIDLRDKVKPVNAIFIGCDPQFRNIAVKELETCLGVQQSALLRRDDLQTIDFHI